MSHHDDHQGQGWEKTRSRNETTLAKYIAARRKQGRKLSTINRELQVLTTR